MKIWKRIFAVACAGALAVCGGTVLRPECAKALAEELPVYESFDDYDTLIGRDGERTAFEQMLAWSGNMTGFVCEQGDPVGTTAGKSLKLTQKSNGSINAWSNGTMETEKLDQSGAKYVRISVRNLSAAEKELIVYVTDIAETTVKFNQQTKPKAMNDEGQEHWAIKWNKAAILEPFGGEKTIVKSTLGASVAIPKDFEGYLYLPLTTDTLEQPGWWLAEGSEYRNDVIDLERLFMVSFGFPLGYDITGTDENTWTIFELDDVRFGKDSAIDDFLKGEQQGSAETAASVIRPVTDEGLTVNHDKESITLDKEVTVSEFRALFALKEGFSLNILKNNVKLSDFETIPADCAAQFTNGTDTFTYAIVYKEPEEKNSGRSEERRGCGSALGGGAAGVGLGIAALAVVYLSKGRRTL